MTRVRHQAPIPEAEGDDWYDRIRCAWYDCENPGSTLHKRVICNAARKHRMRFPSDLCYWCETRLYCCAEHGDYDSRGHIPGAFGKRNIY